MADPTSPLDIKNVVDFYAHWPEIRPRILAIKDGAAITEDETQILGWLVTVVDMVGPQDLQSDPSPDDG